MAVSRFRAATTSSVRLVALAAESQVRTAGSRIAAETELALLSERRQALITLAVTGQTDVATARGIPGMNAVDVEARFEDAIESALLEGGWLAGPASYSHELGLDTAELDAFIKATQPKEFQRLADAHGGH